MAEWGGLLSRCRRKPTQGSNPCLSAFFYENAMRYEVEKIEIWSVIKIVFILSLFLGFMISLLYAGLIFVITLVGSTLAPPEFDSFFPLGGTIAVVLIIFGTLTIAMTNTIAVTILIGLYNLFACWIGGIKVRLKPIDTTPTDVRDSSKEETPS